MANVIPKKLAGQPAFRVQRGVPAALVRSYREPIYDSAEVTNAAPNQDREFFQVPIGQNTPAGVVKTLLHTSMRNAGQLGTPLSFDLTAFNIRYPVDVALADFQSIVTWGVFNFIVGADTNFLTVPVEDVPGGAGIANGGAATDLPTIGLALVKNAYSFMIGRAALHLNSTESFRCRITFPSAGNAVTADTLVRVYMRGTLYKGV